MCKSPEFYKASGIEPPILHWIHVIEEEYKEKRGEEMQTAVWPGMRGEDEGPKQMYKVVLQVYLLNNPKNHSCICNLDLSLSWKQKLQNVVYIM